VKSDQVQISKDESKFSDVIVKSRELQKKGVEIEDKNIEVQKNLFLVKSGKKVKVEDRNTRIPYNEEKVNITKEDVIKTIEDYEEILYAYDETYVRTATSREIMKNTNHNYIGIVKEENGTEYVYPCKSEYILKISPDDPVLDDYYLTKKNKSGVERIKKKTEESDSLHLRMKSRQPFLDITNIRKNNNHPPLVLTVSTFTWWCFLCVSSAAILEISFLFLLYLVLALFFGSILVGSLVKSDRTTRSHNHQYLTPLDNSDIDLDKTLDDYFESKKHTDLIKFDVQESQIRAKSRGRNIEWTISNNGTVPSTVVDFIQDKGFESIEDPCYNVDIVHVDSVKDPKRFLISNCGRWYLKID
jgi:hypothetical protein